MLHFFNCLQFPILERIAAGDMPSKSVASGAVSYITTGSPLPDGADAVVRIEDTQAVVADGHEVAVTILKGVQPGKNVRPIGSDIGVNEQVSGANEELTAAEIGLLAMVRMNTTQNDHDHASHTQSVRHETSVLVLLFISRDM